MSSSTPEQKGQIDNTAALIQTTDLHLEEHYHDTIGGYAVIGPKYELLAPQTKGLAPICNPAGIQMKMCLVSAKRKRKCEDWDSEEEEEEASEPIDDLAEAPWREVFMLTSHGQMYTWARSTAEAMKTALEKFEVAKVCPECGEMYFGLNLCGACLLRARFNGPKIECIICMGETAAFLTLPCTHKFHAKCFRSVAFKEDEVKRHYRPCPCCRAKIACDNTILEELPPPPSVVVN